ncbi:glycosyltransferase [Anabaena subtropica]|uniref:Glycosyltransferase n=1 Tax=Anabaena subtropica FACHB-260 TaxID=2692884 RepID=A0ABR8CJN0_9NOST|nr:glycosyltransferase [Anabaena subtropica]MBD2343417.1 glycosyltransferase [Anabaena subtropica FACHB-260]
MQEQHSYRATIPPVPDGIHRPLWSVMIPSYNCASYLRETLASVLAQDPGLEMMQIEVIDDYSTKDDPEAVVAELGRGRVSFYRQPQNVGHTRNFETCLKRSRGKLIHLLHGDDCVREGFYLKMQQAFDERPEIGAAFCRHIFMDEHGNWQFLSELLQPKSGVLSNWLERIIVKQYIQTPSIVVRREVYESLGGFDRRLAWYEDWEMWVRIATEYGFWYEVEPLAIYRMHSASNSGRYVRTGKNIQDVRRGLEIVQSYLPNYLPNTIVSQLLDKNREYSALCALDTARKMLSVGEIEGANNQIQEALKCSQSFKIRQQAIKLFVKNRVRQILQPVSTSI